MSSAPSPRLELRQGQSLVMTQQLQQSIKLLQCNSLELRAFVNQELEKNPFLQNEEVDAAAAEQSADNSEGESEEQGEPQAVDIAEDSHISDESNNDWDDSEQIERDYLQPAYEKSSSGSYGGEDERTIEDNRAQDKTLRENLLEQLQLDISDPVERMIGAHLIDLVDEAGYMKEEIASLADMLGVDQGDIDNVLAKLQKFEPSGVCARDLQECLRLQLLEKNRLDPAMETLLENLHLLASVKYAELQKKCKVDKDDIRQMIMEIRELNPKPGLAFSYELVQAVEPDIFIRRAPDGDWHVELNMSNFPKVMVNKRYYKTVSKNTRKEEDKEYLSEQYGSANWLVRALEQRAQTMLKVGSEMVKQQDAFFRLGVKYLRPMTLKDVAAETGYHESTISRVTNGKFLVCPRGTFELKYFFTSALSRNHGGSDISSAAVKKHIEELIKKETSEHIFSDDEIVDVLSQRSISIARRTVAKYRDALKIPSSPKRKRLKTNAL